MRSLPTLLCLFLLLAFISHPISTAIVMGCRVAPKLKTDFSNMPNPLEDEVVAEDVEETEALDGPDGGDGREDGLMPAGLYIPRRKWCEFHRRSGKFQCYSRPAIIPLPRRPLIRA
ncbi:hypothetical protein ECG_03020 [Echinococcus granulosus]|nr:hypothetical protein ECG_03020 [Echinococcus granulosus]